MNQNEREDDLVLKRKLVLDQLDEMRAMINECESIGTDDALHSAAELQDCINIVELKAKWLRG